MFAGTRYIDIWNHNLYKALHLRVSENFFVVINNPKGKIYRWKLLVTVCKSVQKTKKFYGRTWLKGQ